MKLRHRLPVAIFVCASLAAPASAAALLSIEPARTRVGLARVKLEIRDLAVAGDRLRGTYEVKIPLAPGLNDRGLIDIDLQGQLDNILARRGTVNGTGHSALDGRSHPILCEFGPDRTILITIDTGDRVLAFKTHHY